jgi:hypothetical protein
MAKFDEEINDTRLITEFKGTTFSKYKKSDVRSELIKSIIDGKIEPACNWSSEFICAGQFLDLWDIILNMVGKHIHLANPKLPIYIEMRYDVFKQIMSGGYLGSELALRNNQKIRNLFAEIICVLCLSNKKHSFQTVDIRKDEYEIVTLSTKLKAPNVEYVNEIFQKDDPKELFIALNEFAYHISNDSKNNLLACYWLEWILEFNTVCKNKKEPCKCARRASMPVEDKHQLDPVWILWEIISKHVNGPNCVLPKKNIVTKVIKSLLHLYCIRFTPGSKRKRRYLLYFAISLITESYSTDKEIIAPQNKDVIEVVTQKINSVYKQIKKNEIAPATDYLMHNVKRSDLEKTIEKIEKLNNLQFMSKKS